MCSNDSIRRMSRRVSSGRRPLAWVGALLAAFLLGPATAAATTAGGGSGLTGAFADLEPGGRAAALGGALGPLADDPSAIHYNPAQLLSLRNSGLAVTYADLYGLNLVHHTGVFLAFPRFAREASWTGGRVCEVEGPPSSVYGIAVQSTQIDLEPESYGEYDIALAVARAGKWGMRYGVAGHVLIVRSDLDDTDASGFSFDLGLAREITPQLQASLMLRSFWSALKWEDKDEETLVPRAQLGLAWRPTEALQIPAELVYDPERSHLQRMAGGVEWSPLGPALALRAGLRWIDDGDSSEILPAAGVGLQWHGVYFDYGMAFGRDELGDTHRFSLRYQF